MSLFPRLAGDLVLYWNDPSRIYMAALEMLKRGENMGNENGRQRAQRMRKEINQKQVMAPNKVTRPDQTVCLAPGYTGVYTPEGNVIKVSSGPNVSTKAYESSAEYDNFVSDDYARGHASMSTLRRRHRR
jgi:hypothetical protein